MNFYQKHHWDAGKAVLGFLARSDWKYGYHGNRKLPLAYNGENGVATFSQLFFIRSFLYLQVMMTCMGARRISKFSQIGQPTAELAALERLKKSS